jgi:hypothetical protein
MAILLHIKEITKTQSYQNYLITPKKQGNTEDFLLFIAAAEKKV